MQYQRGSFGSETSELVAQLDEDSVVRPLDYWTARHPTLAPERNALCRAIMSTAARMRSSNGLQLSG